MNINFTLFIEMLIFMGFVLLTMRYIIPPIEQALEERRNAIAKGLDDAAKAAQQLEAAKNDAKKVMDQAKVEAKQFLENINKRGQGIIQEAKDQASLEREKLLKEAQAEINQKVQEAKGELNQKMALLITQGAEALIKQNMSSKQNEKIIDEYLTEN